MPNRRTREKENNTVAARLWTLLIRVHEQKVFPLVCGKMREVTTLAFCEAVFFRTCDANVLEGGETKDLYRLIEVVVKIKRLTDFCLLMQAVKKGIDKGL